MRTFQITFDGSLTEFLVMQEGFEGWGKTEEEAARQLKALMAFRCLPVSSPLH